MRQLLLFLLLFIISVGANSKDVIVFSINDLKRLESSPLTYILNADVDLNGAIIDLPENTTIILNNRIIYNGCIKGNKTELDFSKGGKVENVEFQGTFSLEEVQYQYFSNYRDDTELLRAMFHLLFYSIKRCSLYLQPQRIYHVNCSKTLKYGHSLFEYYGICNKTIFGNNSIIDDQRSRLFIGYKTYDGVFLFSGCHNITIEKLHYQNLNEDFEEVRDDDGNILYKGGIENQIGYVGTSYILLQNDCSKFNIECDIVGARYGIKVGDYSMFWLCGDYGLRNSIIKIKANKVGYPVAIEIGDHLDIEVESDTHHRAAYLCGISNSKIHIKAKNILISPFHCLLSDTHYSKGNKNKVKYKPCYNLEVFVEELGTELEKKGAAYCVGFQTYHTNPFKKRTEPLTWENIHVRIEKKAYSKHVGLFSFSRLDPKDESDPRRLSDKFKNIYIEAYNIFQPPSCWEAKIIASKNVTYQNVKFKIEAPFSDVIYDNKNKYLFDFTTSDIQNFEYSGAAKIQKCKIKKKYPSVIAYSTIYDLYNNIIYIVIFLCILVIIVIFGIFYSINKKH